MIDDINDDAYLNAELESHVLSKDRNYEVKILNAKDWRTTQKLMQERHNFIRQYMYWCGVRKNWVWL